jgi:hypothetical protein
MFSSPSCVVVGTVGSLVGDPKPGLLEQGEQPKPSGEPMLRAAGVTEASGDSVAVGLRFDVQRERVARHRG